MSAVWMRARAELRVRWRASIAAALLIALGGGLVLGTIAMGRRTDTAYQRFLGSNRGYDVVTSSGAYGAGLSPLDVDAAMRLPEVAAVRVGHIFFFGGKTDSGQVLLRGESAIIADPTPPGPHPINEPKILQGRLPNPARIDEVALGFALADQHHIHVGEGIT
ncbi:MAG: hypothetical protein LC663_03755, partial [Actinobacteria bacterium]|nr:hypothetical protein [Actinomycetota bacterium]